jgi:transglutaminase/protease-like cytokinesis protein 3
MLRLILLNLPIQLIRLILLNQVRSSDALEHSRSSNSKSNPENRSAGKPKSSSRIYLTSFSQYTISTSSSIRTDTNETSKRTSRNSCQINSLSNIPRTSSSTKSIRQKSIRPERRTIRDPHVQRYPPQRVQIRSRTRGGDRHSHIHRPR